MEKVVTTFGAYSNGDQYIGLCISAGFAAGQQVGAWAANSIFNDIGEKRCQDEGDEEG